MSSEALCGYTEEVSTARFIYISIAGVLAFVGCISNLLLLSIFCRRRHSNSPPNLFPAFLSILDSLLCLLFLFIFVVDVNMIYLRNLELFVFYHEYIVVAFATVKIIQFLIPYMLILATFERYTWITNTHQHMLLFHPRGRFASLLVVISLSVCLRLPAASALYVAEFPSCSDAFRTLAVDLRDWAKDNELFTLYDFYGIALLQTFLPFLILMALNVVIVNRLAAIDSKNRGVHEKQVILVKRRSVRLMHSLNLNRMPSSVRNAVYTMVAIVSTYLISNSLHILLTVLEVGKASILMEADDPYKASTVYTLLGDAVSLLYMTSSAIRIGIYAKCNRTIRRQLKGIFSSRKSALLHTVNSITSQSCSPRL